MKYLIILIFIILSVSCTKKPTLEMAKEKVESFNRNYEVVEINKINGFTRDIFGVKWYTMEIECVRKHKETGDKYRDKFDIEFVLKENGWELR